MSLFTTLDNFVIIGVKWNTVIIIIIIIIIEACY